MRVDFGSSGAAKFMAAAALGLLALSAPAQSTYPSKPISLVVQTPPGGPLDAAMRIVAKHLAQRLGNGATVVVDNRPGANGVIAGEYVARSAPDGHTLMGISAAHVANSSIYRGLKFDPLHDLTGVAHLGVARNVFVATSGVPVKDIRQFVAWAKQNPGKVTFGSGGVGSGGHLMAELIAQTTGIRMTHVAYKGGSAMMPDLATGRITFAVDTLKNMRPLVDAGSVRFLGVTNAERWPDLPNVPTFVESGYPEVALNSWIGVAAPSRTPPQVLALLAKELAEISSLPEVRKQFADLGINVLPQPLVGEAYQAFLLKESVFWSRIAKAADVKVD